MSLDRRAFVALTLAALAAPAFASEEADFAAKGYAVGDMALGDPNAPVTVIEYASLTCPHCATFHKDTWPAIREKYVETGKVRFIFRDVYFDQYGLWASMIARCGGEGPFFGYLTTLFGKQAEWARADDIVGELQRIGRLGGLPAERMQACLSDEALLNRLVADYQTNATADNVRSTPTFIINGETATGAMGVAAFSALIDKHL